MKDIKKDKYEVLSESFVDNIFVFYKIINKKIFLTIIEMDAIYHSNFSFEDNFSIYNYNFNICDIKSINFNKIYINISIGKEFSIKIFQNYVSSVFENKPQLQIEEANRLEADKINATKNFIELNKKINNIIQNNFSNILSL